MSFETEQESFWAGPFGDEYIERNQGERIIAANTAFFARRLSQAPGIASIIEFGSNIGLNLHALGRLLPASELHAIEINSKAADFLRRTVNGLTVHHQSILEFEPGRTWDLVLIKGVLIHIAPAELPRVYDKLYRSSARHLLVAEYYNPTPVEIPYRGHTDKLFKRDFAGEMLERFPDLALLDYGFVYRRDPVFPQDDMTWFLLEKRSK